LLYGAYDEAAAGQSFQEALREWRNPGASNSTSNSLSGSGSSMNARHRPDSQGAPPTCSAGTAGCTPRAT
jgi:hypothetical protein